MDTWGDYFFRGWIRTRLFVRRAKRDYWPPRLEGKAWQIATLTGVVSILLTLIALNLPSGTKQGTPDDSKQKLASAKSTGKKSKSATAATDPFADVELAQDDPPLQDLGLDGVTDNGDKPDSMKDQFEAPMVVADDSVPADQVIDDAESKPNLKPQFDPQADEVAQSEMKRDDAEVEKAVPPADDIDSSLALGTDSIETTPPSKEELVARHSALSTPIRSGNHLSRFGQNEDSEDDRHSVRGIRPTRVGAIVIPGKHEVAQVTEPVLNSPAGEDKPVVAPVEPSLPDLETAKPVATPDVEMPVEAKPQPKMPIVSPMPVEADENPFGIESSQSGRVMIEEAESDAPPVLIAPEPVETPFEPTPAVRPDSALPEGRREGEAPTPSLEPVVTHQPPLRSTKGIDHETHEDEDNIVRKGSIGSVVQPAQPVPEAAPEVADTAVPNLPPARSTKGIDHDEHADEDNIERKGTPASISKPMNEGAQESTSDVVEPVVPQLPHKRSSNAIDHEAHQDEDNFDRPVRKSPSIVIPPAAPEAPMTEPDAPVTIERRKPEEALTTPRTVPRTAPRITPRTAPRVIHELDEPPEDPTPRRVTPMAVPAMTPRGPERISVPDRLQDVVDQAASTRPRTRIEAPATTLPRGPSRGAPLLTMEISGPRQAPVGTQVVMHFKVKNIGTAPATGIVVSDVLPAGMQHRLSANLEYTVARLEPGESRETNLTVLCTTKGLITNRAVLTADGEVSIESDFQIEVVSWSSKGLADEKPAKSPLTVSHHGPAHWLVDSTGQFLVTVTNNSGERQRNVTISHVYPPGTNLVHATIGHQLDVKNRTVSWTIPDFAPGASYILETELHSLATGPGKSLVRVKIGDAEVAEDTWTAISDGPVVRR